MAREVSKEEAEEILAKDRHNQIAKLLSDIKVTLSQPKNEAIKQLIEKQSGVLSTLIEAINNISIPQASTEIFPEVAIEAIIKIENKIDQVLAVQGDIFNELRIMNQPKEWVFDVKRGNYTHLIEKVTAYNYTAIKGQA